MNYECPNYTAEDANARWGPAGRSNEDAVERGCPWCASWLRKDPSPPAPFESAARCVNLLCPLLPTGGCYWEPYPEGWTEDNIDQWKQSR